MTAALDMIGGLSAWLWVLPPWAGLLLYGVLTAYTIAAGGYALARSGIRPLWVLMLWVPYVNIVMLWAWAYGKWPVEAKDGV